KFNFTLLKIWQGLEEIVSLFFRILVALGLISGLLGAPAFAKGGKSKSQSELAQILADRNLDKSVRYVINNSLFTMYHEVGHLLVDKHQWPVLGREEDVADNFATYILLTQRRRSFHEALKDSALGWKLEDQAYGRRNNPSDYYNEHSLDLQRAYQIVCMMVGEDRDTFYQTAQEWRIDRDRQVGCRADYQQISRSLESLLSPHLNTPAQANVTIEYERAGEDMSLAYKTLRDSRLLESVAVDLRKNYGLTGNIKITASRCGEANAFYDSSNSEIIMCYELLDDYFTLINRHLATNGIN
ncbi:MAG: DUF4344 domain-containing metallopeptidase, partial [Devosiaceae bacterium]|nr:DUF4344 domain-containing metallopeptidase [Devosiaceae bacterium]